jgi:hypothetical protein
MTLLALQRSMREYLIRGADEIRAQIHGDPSPRLAVYHRAYRAQLLATHISPTITSQAHNYFIHRLINERDLQTIASAVSYIDRVTEESIPNLPTGTCVFSGVASQMPLKINIRPLADDARPRRGTRQFSEIVPQLLLGA